MNDYFIEKLTEVLQKGLREQTEENKAILNYGITATFLNLPKIIILLISSKKLKLMKPVLLLFVFYGFIRNFSRGIHAKTSKACFVWGMINYLSMAGLSTVLNIPKKIYDLFFVYFFWVYSKYAPSGTETNPIYIEHVEPLKIRSLQTIAVFYFIGKYANGVLRNIAFISLLSQSISIIPITYKLSKQKGGLTYE